MSILDRLKGVIKREEPENPALAQLMHTVRINEQDPAFYAVPGTTHSFVPRTDDWGKGTCARCGYGETVHERYNQIKPAPEWNYTKPRIARPVYSPTGKKTKYKKAVMLEYQERLMRAYEQRLINKDELEMLLDNPDVGIKHMIQGY